MKLVYYCPNEECANHYGVAFPEADWQTIVELYEMIGVPLTGVNCACSRWLPLDEAEWVEDDWTPGKPPDQITTATPDDTPVPGTVTEPAAGVEA